MAKKSKRRIEEEYEEYEEELEASEYDEDSEEYEDEEYEEDSEAYEEDSDEYEEEEYDEDPDEYEEEYTEEDRAYFRHKRRVRNQIIAIIVFIILVAGITIGAIFGINTVLNNVERSQAAELQKQIKEMENSVSEEAEEPASIDTPDENY